MLWFLMTSIALAEPVHIGAESPGVVRVRATGGAVFMPACAGVSWERFDVEAQQFVPLPTPPCGPLAPALVVGKVGLSVALGTPLPGKGMHVVRSVVVVAERCDANTPFPLAACVGLSHQYGPNQVVRVP
jgi:hypothetical protein